MRNVLLFFLLMVISGNTLAQHKLIHKPFLFETKIDFESYVFRYDTSDAWYFYSADARKSFNIDSLVFQKNRADSLCRDITFLSKKADVYFQALQLAYTSLREVGLDSVADRIKGISWSYRFRICR